jgi:hypothetical protein
MQMKHGQRVGVVVAGGYSKMIHLGYGTYTHDRVPVYDETKKRRGGIYLPNHFSSLGIECPVISLDNGGEIFSCECKLCTEDTLKDLINNKEHGIEAIEITLEELWQEGKLEELLGGTVVPDSDDSDIKQAV